MDRFQGWRVRRLMVLGLAVAAAAAASLVLGAATLAGPIPVPRTAHQPAMAVAHPTAATRSPLATLDATFRRLIPATRCAAAASTVTTAKRRRAAALKGARTATARRLAAKRASMRSAIALMRKGVGLCTPPAPPVTVAGPGAPAPPPPAPPAPPAPPQPPPPQVLTLHVAPGQTIGYTETSATATAGTMRIALVNASDLQHFVGIRTATGQPTIAESPLSPAKGTTFVDVTLPPGTYQVFCRNNGHDKLGMTMPLTVS